MRRSRILISLILFWACWVLNSTSALSQTANDDKKPKPEVYTGTVIGIGGRMGGVSRTFTLSIDGYTSDDEATRFLDELKEFKQEGLLKAIRKEKKGWVAVSGRAGKDINVIRTSMTQDGKRRIVILFERWLNMYELRAGTRTQDYPFSYAEIYIDADGKGQGTFIALAKIKFVVDKKTGEQTIELENFGTYPARVVITKRK